MWSNNPYSKQELQKLKEKAEDLVRDHNLNNDGLAQVKKFYRNKPITYFLDIVENKGGIMEPYPIDNGNDPRCPVKGKLKALHFSANNGTSLDPNVQPTRSPFGETRLLLPSGRLLSKSGHRLYFKDFFCLRRRSPPIDHYINLTVTKSGSEEDKICSQFLLELDIMDNEFLSVDKDGRIRVCNMPRVWIEIAYTEAVDMPLEFQKHGADMKLCQSTGAGSSKPQGKPKVGCSKCTI